MWRFSTGFFSSAVLFYAFLLSTLVTTAPAARAAEKSGWQAQWETAVAGAKKEGAVSLWGDMEITHPDIVAAFTKEFVSLSRSPSPDG